MAEKNENKEKRGNGGQSGKNKNSQSPKPLKLRYGKKIEVEGFFWGQHFVINLIAKVIIGQRLANKGECIVKFKRDGIEFIGQAETDEFGEAILTYKKLNADVLRHDFKGHKIEIMADTIAEGKPLEDSVEIELHLPAGDLSKGIQAAWIRRWHLVGDIIRATAVASFIYYFLGHAGHGTTNPILGFLIGYFLIANFVYWRASKFIPKLKAINRIWEILAQLSIALIFAMICWINSNLLTKPMMFAVLFSYFGGGFFFWVEELWRRADGKPITNFYPIWPILIAVSMVLFNWFDLLSWFVPKYTVVNQVDVNQLYKGAVVIQNGLAYTLSGEPSRLTMWLYGIQNPIFHKIFLVVHTYGYPVWQWIATSRPAVSIATANWFAWFCVIMGLGPYAMPLEIWEKIRGKNKIAVGEGETTRTILLIEMFRYIRDWLAEAKKVKTP